MSNSNVEGNKIQRILIVDDEIEIQKMLKRMLVKTPYEATTASDGVSALEELSHQDYELAIIDLNMPKMDGETLISKIREDNDRISIMVLTGHGSLEKGVTLLKKYHISNFLQKPLEGPTHFLFSLENIFEKRRKDIQIQEQSEILAKKNIILEQEIIQRKVVEEKLEKSNVQLEKRVEARTMTLQSTNQQLALEIEKSEELVRQLEDRQLQNRRIVKEQTELICQLEVSKREAEKAQEEAKSADKAKSHFIANVSHEIRTPITSIRESLRLILKYREQITKDDEDKFLNSAYSSTCHLSDLIENILDFSQIESGQLNLEIEPLSFHDVVKEIEQSFMPLVEKAKLSMTFRIPQNLPQIRADIKQLRQSLFNIIGNAIKFTEEGKSIVVEAKEEENQILVSVQDTGIGIAPEFHNKVFDRFIRADNSGKVKGTGIGLSITKEIIESMKGTIWFESQLGEGTTFYFTMPKVDTT